MFVDQRRRNAVMSIDESPLYETLRMLVSNDLIEAFFSQEISRYEDILNLTVHDLHELKASDIEIAAVTKFQESLRNEPLLESAQSDQRMESDSNDYPCEPIVKDARQAMEDLFRSSVRSANNVLFQINLEDLTSCLGGVINERMSPVQQHELRFFRDELLKPIHCAIVAEVTNILSRADSRPLQNIMAPRLRLNLIELLCRSSIR